METPRRKRKKKRLHAGQKCTKWKEKKKKSSKDWDMENLFQGLRCISRKVHRACLAGLAGSP